MGRLNFALEYPELLNDWDYERNNKRPEDYSPGSHKKVWWICRRGKCCVHNFEASIRGKISMKLGCPYCSGYNVCSHNNLAIHHPELVKEWDYERNKKKPEDYHRSAAASVWWICRNCIDNCHRFKATINNRDQGTNCPFCFGSKACPHNNLGVIYPHLIDEWHEDNEFSPYDYTPNSSKKVLWKCKRDNSGLHVWRTSICHRSSDSEGCPYCCGRNICLTNSFATKFPKILIEWDKDLNILDPYNIGSSSPEKVYWKCKNSHSWRTELNSRTVLSINGEPRTGCPVCSSSRKSSMKEIYWIETLIREQNIPIQYSKSPEGQFYISSVGYVDGYCSENNTVYEFHGSFWHGDPRFYNPNDFNPVNKVSFGTLYNGTIMRDNRIRSLGYNLIVKWEREDNIVRRASRIKIIQ